MDKFTKLKPNSEPKQSKKVKTLYKDDYVQLVNYDNWSILQGKDCVICIPYLIEENKFIIRQEYIPSYKISDGQEMHLSCVGGEIEEGESPEESLLREIQEEAGLVIRDGYNLELERPLFFSKSSSIKCYYCIVPLTENDYHEVVIKGDGSKTENMSQTAKIDIKYLGSLTTSDITTEFMLTKFKEYLSL